ncbi:MAG: ABC transporter permease [Acidobacteria bacterium]|nr:ABC transporter permease [Acidobacteriota bacterium]
MIYPYRPERESSQGRSRRRHRLSIAPLDLIRETWADLNQNRLRSFLTMLGIAWGVASLIILVAVGEGMRQAHMEKMYAMGRHIIIVWGGSTSIAGPGIRPNKQIYLTVDDYEILQREAFHLQRLSPELSRYDLISATDINQGNFDVSGVLVDYMAMRSIFPAQGRQFIEKDITDAARVCIIGHEVNRQLFAGRAAPGDPVRLQGYTYRLVGILPPKTQNGSYSGRDDGKIFVPYPAMRRDFPFRSGPYGDRHISNLILQPKGMAEGDVAELQVREILARHHHFDPLDEDALPIWNTATDAKFITQIFSSMKLFLGFVAVVTLLLGGIGVMNIMLVSVRERTREIGLRKALGATRLNILAMFFLEALLISLGSGLLGYLGAMGLCGVINSLPLPDVFAGMIVSKWVGLSAFGFLVFVALAAAFYPSYTAAFLDPVEALRFEE